MLKNFKVDENLDSGIGSAAKFVSGSDNILERMDRLGEERKNNIEDFISRMGANIDLTLFSVPLVDSNISMYNRKFSVQIFSDKKLGGILGTVDKDIFIQVWNGSRNVILGVGRDEVNTRNWRGEEIPTDDVDKVLVHFIERFHGHGVDDIFKDVSNNEGRSAPFIILD